jgi:general secretion pathway protein G
MIVIAILGILVGLSVPRALTALLKAKSKSAQAQITILSGAIEFYRLDVRSYPPNLEALLAAPRGVSNWDGPYLKRKTVPKDPWNHDILYRIPGATTPYELICLGADHAVGGKGENRDVCLWR